MNFVCCGSAPLPPTLPTRETWSGMQSPSIVCCPTTMLFLPLSRFSTQAAAIRAAFGLIMMISAVTDDMVAALSFAGTRDDVRDQAREFDGLYDRLILGSPFFGVGQEETRANHAGLLEAFAQ